ncbi:MAG: hypothetical protein GY749_21645 [Desulfobacteraceae bacterium]|nr:hypothetical protein [Desulfobacteraceae bacterium]
MLEGEESWKVKPMPVPEIIGDEPDLNPMGQNDEIYSTSIRFPYSIVGNISTGTMWDEQLGEWQIIEIPIALFHYNPVTKRLYTINASQAVITFEHKASRRSRSIPAVSYPSQSEQRLRQLAVNFDRIAPEYRILSRARRAVKKKTGYVIITTRSIVSGSNELDNFISHKENRGFNVYVMTEDIWGGGTGDTAAENIRSWLISNYQRLHIEYVLLIGNPNSSTGDVPMKMLYPRENESDYRWKYFRR